MSDDNGVIRKVIFGSNLKDGMAYTVGMSTLKGKVSVIYDDTKFLYDHGKTLIRIFVDTGDGMVVWKEVKDVPHTIEYDLSWT